VTPAFILFFGPSNPFAQVQETITIRDTASGQTGSATFTFKVLGELSAVGSFLTLVPSGPTSEVLHLGHYFYTVSEDPYMQVPGDLFPPIGAGPIVDGQLRFNVRVQHNPEPSALLLGGLGMVLAVWRRLCCNR
jgi:hypothetical protein